MERPSASAAWRILSSVASPRGKAGRLAESRKAHPIVRRDNKTEPSEDILDLLALVERDPHRSQHSRGYGRGRHLPQRATAHWCGIIRRSDRDPSPRPISWSDTLGNKTGLIAVAVCEKADDFFLPRQDHSRGFSRSGSRFLQSGRLPRAKCARCCGSFARV